MEADTSEACRIRKKISKMVEQIHFISTLSPKLRHVVTANDNYIAELAKLAGMTHGAAWEIVAQRLTNGITQEDLKRWEKLP